jgi:phage terminase Nu1 subunit (DNA packaging protein)
MQEEIRIRFPLPDGVPDAVLNKGEVADFFGVSAPTVEAWVGDGMPALKRGTNGSPWEFEASAIWAWKCARDHGAQVKSDEARRTIEAMRLALTGGSLGDTIAALPAKEQRELFAVSVERERLMRIRNQTLERDDVRDFLDTVFSLIRDGVSSLPDRLERDAGLSAKGVDTAIESCDDLLDMVGKRIRDFFDARPEKTAAERTDLFTQ